MRLSFILFFKILKPYLLIREILKDAAENSYQKVKAKVQSMGRPSWDEVWMQTARVIACRSIDPRYKKIKVPMPT